MEDSKIFTIFAGINGAGKSTLYYTLGEQNFGLRLNSDDIVARSGSDWRDGTAQFRAGREVVRLQNQCLEQGVSFNRETTLGGLSILNTIEKAKNLGYKVNLLYIGLDSLDTAKKRVSHRVQLGGHGIDEETMNIRHSVIERNLLTIMPYLDDVKMFDNSGKGIELVAYKSEGELIKVKQGCKWLDRVITELENQKALS